MRITAYDVKELGINVEETIGYADDEETEELFNDYPILKDYLFSFTGMKAEVEEYGIAEVADDRRYLFEGVYVLTDENGKDELYELDGSTATKWQNRTGTEYVCQLSEEEQRIVRMVITGYVYTELTDYTEEEKKAVIENAMDERICNITDAESVREILSAMGIL